MVRSGFLLGCVLVSGVATARVDTPKEFLGFEVCQDYHLANYQQLTAYWQKLAKQSNRIKLQSIGKTEGGRDQWMAIISDPGNLRRLEDIRKTSLKVSRVKGFKDENDFLKTAKTAKTVVWIDGGLHANEVLGAQQLIETAYQLVSRNDDENRRILKDSVILLVHANPDGMDQVSDWYMRRSDPKTRSLANLPELYQKYAGHDNNRDFYQMNLKETQNMNRILYREWAPQVMYNHHQSAPAGTIMFVPPFRNPFNYHVDALVNNSTDLVGTFMLNRMIGKGLGGTVSRDGASFSAWWNGGLRTMTYFHNMVGILTETWGSPNPTPVPYVADRQVPTTDLPKPVEIREWHLRDSLKYEIEANYAILDYASRYRDKVLYSVYRSGLNSVENGSKDTWTRYPSRMKALGLESLKKPVLRDARAYVIPPNQPDLSATKRFVDILLKAGVDVHRAKTASSGVPSGSYVVLCDQPFRPHILDMFEFQDYPNDLAYPGGPPKPPYDNAGYTPAFTMGVKFDLLLESPGVLDLEVVTSTQGGTLPSGNLVLPFTENESYRIANMAKRARMKVSVTEDGFQVAGSQEAVKKLADQTGDLFLPKMNVTAGIKEATPYVQPRIGLLDRFGGSMPSGWTRWLLEQFAFDYTVVFPPDLDRGDLKSKFDVILVPSGLIGRSDGRDSANPIQDDPTIDAKFKARWGSISFAKSIAALKEFAEQGGTIVAMGTSSAGLAIRMDLPVAAALVDPATKRPLENSKFYVPGSVLNIALKPHRLTRGMGDRLDILFDDSPAFLVAPGATSFGVFNTPKPLRSGWALGQELLNGSSCLVDIPFGRGFVTLLAPEVNFRGQTHASFKLIFNAILRAGE